MTIHRRKFLALAGASATLPAFPRIVCAQAYPSRPVRILVATVAGGSTDIVARLIAQWLTEKLGQPFVVENRPGGNNNIGTEAAARAAADGHTLFMANSVNTINASIYEKLSYNFIADFAPVTHTMISPMLLMVHPSVAAKSLPELIALLKASPDKINMASGGLGSSGFMAGELLKLMAGIKFAQVPYRGEAPAVTDLIGGQAQFAITTTGSAIQYVRAGTVRAIAVTTPQRIVALPDVPAIAETVPGYQASSWSGLMAPKSTPAEILDRLHNETAAALADPKIAQRIADMGGAAPGGTRTEFAKFLVEETDKWAKVAKVAGVKIN